MTQHTKSKLTHTRTQPTQQIQHESNHIEKKLNERRESDDSKIVVLNNTNRFGQHSLKRRCEGS